MVNGEYAYVLTKNVFAELDVNGPDNVVISKPHKKWAQKTKVANITMIKSAIAWYC